MRLFSTVACAFGAALVVAAVAACSSRGTQFNPIAPGAPRGAAARAVSSAHGNLQIPASLQPFVINGMVSTVPKNLSRDLHPSWMRYTDPDASSASKDVLWVTGFGFPAPIGKYYVPNAANRGPRCLTPGLTAVNAIGTDATGHLWVPVGNNGPGTGYAQQYTCKGSQGTNISDPKGQPSDVAFDSKGNLYVGNVINYVPFGSGFLITSGTVKIYASDGSPSGEMTDPSFTAVNPPNFDFFQELYGVAVDSHDNCFVSHADFTGAGEVVEFPGCKPAKHGKILAGPHPWNPSKPAFDSAGNLLIADTSWIGFYRHPFISVYAPPYSGPPTSVIPLFGSSISCPLSTNQKRLYCGNDVNGSVDVYSYPAGKYLYSFNKGLEHGALGVAVAPRTAE